MSALSETGGAAKRLPHPQAYPLKRYLKFMVIISCLESEMDMFAIVAQTH